MRRREAAAGFTLVELLVVVGIVSVLIALLLPVLGRARRQAQGVVCLSNLRFIGAEMVTYVASERNGRFPGSQVDGIFDGGVERPVWLNWQQDPGGVQHPPGTVYDRIRLFGRLADAEMMYCPVDSRERWVGWAYPYSYTMNCWVFRQPPQNGRYLSIRTSEIRNPSQKVLVIDQAAPYGDDDIFEPVWPLVQPWYCILSIRHQRDNERFDRRDAGSGNVLFADGHCELFPRTLTFDPRHFDLVRP